MPVTLAKVASNTALITLQVQAGDEVNELNITYYPSRVTEETFAQLQIFNQMSESSIAESFEALNEALATVIKSWDLYEDDEQTQPYPIEAGKLKKLPIELRLSIIQAIMGDMRPNRGALQTGR